MNKRSKRTLQRLQENDPTLTELYIGSKGLYEEVTVSNFSKLGNALGKNKHVTKLSISIDGLKLKSDNYRNHRLFGYGGKDGYEGHQILTNTLRVCTNLKVIELIKTDITDRQLTSIVAAARWMSVLEELNLSHNQIGNVGCEILAALLRLPGCNLQSLNLEHNNINNEGLISIANELVNNKKLTKLYVDRAAIDQDVTAAFSRLSFYASTSITGIDQVVFSRLSCVTISNNGTAPTAQLVPPSTTASLADPENDTKVSFNPGAKSFTPSFSAPPNAGLQSSSPTVPSTTMASSSTDVVKKENKVDEKTGKTKKQLPRLSASDISSIKDKAPTSETTHPDTDKYDPVKAALDFLGSQSSTTASSTSIKQPNQEKVNRDKKEVVNNKEEDTGETWKRVSGIILGQVVTYRQYYSTHYIRDILQTLLKTIKNGCCSDVPAGCLCGHCEASITVIRISRAVILSICKLPLKKIRDRDTSRDLKRIRSWIYNQVKEFKDDSGDEIKAVLPPKLSEIIFVKKFDIHPPWEEDDFGILLQQPSPSWIVRVNMLMLMGYKVVLVNFNDVARFSRKDLNVVHNDFSRLLCPVDSGVDGDSDSESDIRVADDSDKALSNQPPLSDDEPFKQLPPLEDCPICCFRMPLLGTGRRYMTCCGKTICSGCIYAVEKASAEDVLMCPYCSTPEPETDKESVERIKARMKLNDAEAIYKVGVYCRQGRHGYPLNNTKALELFHQAAELGFTSAYNHIGGAYINGRGVELDKKKAIHYWELAAMRGDAIARHNLGINEAQAGNMDRAVKHYIIAAKRGSDRSLELMKRMHENGHATKDDYTRALQARQSYLDEIKSDRRDEAADHDEKKYKYY